MIIIPKIQNEKQVHVYNEKGHYITSITILQGNAVIAGSPMVNGDCIGVPLSNGRTVIYQFNESSRSITYKRTI